MPRCFAAVVGNKGSKHQLAAMVVDCSPECLLQTFDSLKMHDGGVDVVKFVEEIALLSDDAKFPETRRPLRKSDSEGLWLPAVNRLRGPLEEKFLGMDPPRIFETAGTRQTGGHVEKPLDEMLVDFHGSFPHSHRLTCSNIVRVKKHLHEHRERTCFYCSKNHQQLATEAYEADCIEAPWPELHTLFIQLDHTFGR